MSRPTAPHLSFLHLLILSWVHLPDPATSFSCSADEKYSLQSHALPHGSHAPVSPNEYEPLRLLQKSRFVWDPCVWTAGMCATLTTRTRHHQSFPPRVVHVVSWGSDSQDPQLRAPAEGAQTVRCDERIGCMTQVSCRCLFMKRGVRRGDWVTGMCEVRFRLGQCFLASMMVLGRWYGVSISTLKVGHAVTR